MVRIEVDLAGATDYLQNFSGIEVGLWPDYFHNFTIHYFSLEERNTFGNMMHRMLKLGLSIDEDEVEDTDMPLLEEADVDADGSKMEEVDLEQLKYILKCWLGVYNYEEINPPQMDGFDKFCLKLGILAL